MSKLVDFPLFLFVVSLVALWLSAQIGDFLRKTVRPLKEKEEREDFGIVLSAALTLLTLILAFSFSMAITRYDQRKNYEEAEANAIGTEYVRADLLPAAEAVKVRELLRKYLDQRVLFYTTRDELRLKQIDADTANLQTELWSAVRIGAANTHGSPSRFRHERCAERTGIHSGRLVEPHPRISVGSDRSDCHLLQHAARVLCA